MALAAATTALAGGEPVRITILGAGDVYNFADKKGRGGLARLNAVARAERAANPNTIYVFDGDMLSPSILSGFDHGQNMIDLTNIVPFDLAVPGNHEFDFGVANFLEKMAASNYPWAAVNVTNADGSAIAGLGGTVMKEFEGVKVALVPVAQDTTPEVSTSEDLQFGPTVKSAIAAAKAARKAGADIVIGVIQTDQLNDREIVKSHAFDVVISGDDHSYGTSYDGVTAYVETSIDARILAPLDITATIGEKRGKRKVRWSPSFRFIDTRTVEPDPETQAMVEALQAQLDESLNVVIGVTEGSLDTRRNVVRSQESAFANVIADAMRAATGADVTITNGGGIRGDRTYDAGVELTRKDILTELPFGNATVMTAVTGKKIMKAMENGFSQVEKGAGRFPQVSGMTVEWNPNAPAGSRVVSITIGGADLDPAATYTLATNDYMLGGGDGYRMLRHGSVIIDKGNGNLMANDVIDYIAGLGTVNAAVEGRLKVVGQ
ncbi:MAG: bifunctional metallophosphatase/5'-nucleotidase [Paracoccaceae bacterium]